VVLCIGYQQRVMDRSLASCSHARKASTYMTLGINVIGRTSWLARS
jgi:hypothetical protein